MSDFHERDTMASWRTAAIRDIASCGESVECPPRPQDTMDSAAWYRRGKWLAKQTERTTSQVDQVFALRQYHAINRELVAREGECHGGCDARHITLEGGLPICNQTRRVCPRYRLGYLLEAWTLSATKSQPKQGQLVPAAKRDKLLAIESLRRQASQEIIEAENAGHDMLKGLTIAKAMRQLRELLTDEVMSDVMALMNTTVGFDTDRPNAKQREEYDMETVRDCTITALLQGFRVTGNEWNIIAGKFYPAQAGCKRLVEEWPGLHDLVLDIGVPQQSSDKGALVPAVVSWMVGERRYQITCSAANPNGKTETERMDTRLPVRVNAGMGVDAIKGKAKRKLYAMVMERMTGVSQDDIGTAQPSETIIESDYDIPAGEQVLANIRQDANDAKTLTELADVDAVFRQACEQYDYSEEEMLPVEATISECRQAMEEQEEATR